MKAPTAAPQTPQAPGPVYLLLAHRHVRQPSWPQDLDACLRHAIYGPLIRGMAWRLLRQAQKPAIPPNGSRWAFDARAAAACNDR
jgi:hypothetical protein